VWFQCGHTGLNSWARAKSCEADVQHTARSLFDMPVTSFWRWSLSFFQVSDNRARYRYTSRDSIADYTQTLLVSASRLGLRAQYHLLWSASFRRSACLAAANNERSFFPSCLVPSSHTIRSATAARYWNCEKSVVIQLLSADRTMTWNVQYSRLYLLMCAIWEAALQRCWLVCNSVEWLRPSFS